MTTLDAVASPSVARIGYRPITAADGPAIEAMVARCSPASRYARFLAPLPSLPSRELERILHPGLEAGGWVALDTTAEPEGRSRAGGTAEVVALAQWAMVDTGLAELGLLVEDDRQRQGIGTALLSIVAAQARAAGACDLTATVLAESHHVHRLVAGVFGPITATIDGSVAVLTTVPGSQSWRHRSGTQLEDCSAHAGGN